MTVLDSPQKSLFTPEQIPGAQLPWEQAADADQLSAGVVFGRPLDTVFYYLVPDELRDVIAPGQRVRAPFGKSGQLTTGYCVSLGAPPVTYWASVARVYRNRYCARASVFARTAAVCRISG